MQANTKERNHSYMKRGGILGTLVASGLVISAVAQDNHLQSPPRPSVTAPATAQTPYITDTPATDSQVSVMPRELLKEYEKQMVPVTLATCEELTQTAQAAGEGGIDLEQAEYLSGQRLELGMIRLQSLKTLHQIPDDKIQKETKQASEVQSSGGALVAPPPDSSPDVSEAIVKYLKLTPLQIATIQAQIEKERGQVRPLLKRLAKNRRALIIAATRKGRFDVRQVRDLATEKSRIEEQLIVANAHLQARVYKTLTLEQQRRIDDIRTETAGLTKPPFRGW
jgi:Spy/CpxP family protein refolding chaperone